MSDREEFPEPVIAPRPDTPGPAQPDNGIPVPIIAPRPDAPLPQQ